MLSEDEDEDEASPNIVKLSSIKQVKAKPETPTQTGLKQKSTTTQIIGQKSLVMEEEEQEEVVNNFKIKKTTQNEEDEAELPPVIQVSEYELQVQKNIAERAKILESLGLFTAKEELLEVSRALKLAEKTLYRGIAREPKSPVRPKEIRRSLRQQNITPDSLLFRRSRRQQHATPDGVQLTLPSEKAVAQAEDSYCSKPSRPPPGKLVLKRWKNRRNYWVKAQKRSMEGKTSGASVNTTKKYVYENRLSFLKKNIIPRETESSFTAENVESTETDGTQHSVSCSAEESSTPRVGKRKWKLDDIEKIIIDNLQTPEDRHLSFFKGILPTLQQLSEEQTLQFQMGVLNLLQNIRNAQSFVQPSPSYSQPMQCNAFYTTHPNKFYPTPASSSTNLVGTNFQHRNNPSPNTVDNFTNHQEYIRPTSPNPSEMSDHLNIDFTTLT